MKGKLAEALVQTRAFGLAKALALDLLSLYLRVEVSGFEKIPRTGPAVVIANHSGFSGFDAVILAHMINRHAGRDPRILAHRAYFEWSDTIRNLCFKLKLREPHIATATQTLQHGHVLIVFPEGEAGNFKSSLHRYRLQPFHSGFLRLASQCGAPIFPCVITGAEETHLNLGNINLTRWKPQLRIPLPLNLFPLPAKWKIKILDPLAIAPPGNFARETNAIQRAMQHTLDREVRKRKYIYFPSPFESVASRRRAGKISAQGLRDSR